MKFDFYQIDCFTNNVFGGNPACVVPLSEWISDNNLKKIAEEQGLPETAFFVNDGDVIHLRWFTPEIEIDLCGHATLATAYVLKNYFNYGKPMLFKTISGGISVEFKNELYYLDFPSRKPIKAELPDTIKQSLNLQPVEVLKARDFVLVYENENDIREIKINRQKIDEINLDPGGVVVTSPGKNCDFTSRYFVPQASIFEDPVTGSAHCSLIPFWGERLGKSDMHAVQLSKRGGFLHCIDKDDRVLIGGNAKTFSMGNFWIE